MTQFSFLGELTLQNCCG